MHKCSGSIARSSISAFRAGDAGSNPARSTIFREESHYMRFSFPIVPFCSLNRTLLKHSFPRYPRIMHYSLAVSLYFQDAYFTAYWTFNLHDCPSFSWSVCKYRFLFSDLSSSFMLIALGLQTFFSSFMLSIIADHRRRWEL